MLFLSRWGFKVAIENQQHELGIGKLDISIVFPWNNSSFILKVLASYKRY